MNRRKGQSGQAIVIMAGIIFSLTMLGALVFDAALAMSDRRIQQASADAASLAGVRSFGSSANQGVNQGNWTAMEYLATPLGFSLPVAGCTATTACAAGTYILGSYTVTLTDSGSGSYPTVMDVTVNHQQPSIFARLFGVTYLNDAAAARAVMPTPNMIGSNYAIEALNGNAQVNGGGSGVQQVSGPVYSAGNFGANNVPHATGVATVQQDSGGSNCSGNPQNHIDSGSSSNSGNWNGVGSGSVQQNFNVAPPTSFASYAPTIKGPTYTSAAAAQYMGNWQPGIYNGFAPSGGTMNGGVYKIINNTGNINLGTITNTIYTPPGTVDAAGAVVIVLDSSDTGGLDISNAILNGLDDLNPPSFSGPRDPMGTHNFVIFGGNGASGYTGGVTIGPKATTNMSGIIYLPQTTLTTEGGASPVFVGAAIFSSLTVNGGGNGTQSFNWVCGLNVIAGISPAGGLVR